MRSVSCLADHMKGCHIEWPEPFSVLDTISVLFPQHSIHFRIDHLLKVYIVKLYDLLSSTNDNDHNQNHYGVFASFIYLRSCKRFC